jgi:hypothetical protein
MHAYMHVVYMHAYTREKVACLRVMHMHACEKKQNTLSVYVRALIKSICVHKHMHTCIHAHTHAERIANIIQTCIRTNILHKFTCITIHTYVQNIHAQMNMHTHNFFMHALKI